MSDAEQAHLFGEPSDSHTSSKPSLTPAEAQKEFVTVFNRVAPEQHRYTVFKDFVTAAAIAQYNALAQDEKYEAEYLTIEAKYKKGNDHPLAELYALLVLSYGDRPTDVLGDLFMQLGLGNDRTGQFFTPYHVSKLMAGIAYGGELENLSKPFITLSEPTCGAGGMVLAFADTMLDYGHNPHERLWVQCQDIDRVAAMMCYIQLNLWHIAGVVMVGDTLAGEVREFFHTTAHHLGEWDERFKMMERIEMMRRIICGEHSFPTDDVDSEVETDDAPSASSEPPKSVSQTPMQFDFEF